MTCLQNLEPQLKNNTETRKQNQKDNGTTSKTSTQAIKTLTGNDVTSPVDSDLCVHNIRKQEPYVPYHCSNFSRGSLQPVSNNSSTPCKRHKNQNESTKTIQHIGTPGIPGKRMYAFGHTCLGKFPISFGYTAFMSMYSQC